MLIIAGHTVNAANDGCLSGGLRHAQRVDLIKNIFKGSGAMQKIRINSPAVSERPWQRSFELGRFSFPQSELKVLIHFEFLVSDILVCQSP